MASRVPVRPVVAFAATVVLGAVIAATAPNGAVAAAQWPVGAATGCALWVGRRGAVRMVLASWVALVAAYLIGGLGVLDSVGVGAAQAIAIAVVVVVLTDAGRRQATLLAESDIGRYVLAAVCGGLVAGLLTALWVAASGFGVRGTALGVGAQHLASQLVLLPFFMRMHTHRPTALPVERTAQWLATVVVTVIVFGPDTRASTVFLVLTVLAWGARRLGTWEALCQMVVVAVVATVLTRQGYGPFAQGRADFAWSLDSDAFLLATFVCCASFVVVPLVLTVGLQLQSLAESSVHADRLERIVSSAQSTAIIATDDTGAMTLFNPAAERLLGYAAADVLGKHPRMFYPDEQVTALAEEFGIPDDFLLVAQRLCRPENAGREIRFVRSDGVVRIHLMTLSTVHDRDGLYTGFVNISEDVTDRVREQESLQLALDQQRAVDEAKDVFVSSVSHELRTPLASIIGYVELLHDGAYGALAERQADAISRIAANSDRLLALIDDLLVFSRLGDDTDWIDRIELDLSDVVRGACEMLEPTWAGRELAVDVLAPEQPVLVCGDRNLLERLVLNLVGNAVKFTPDGGRIDVAVHLDDGWAVVEVADTGVGISPEDLPSLFARFYRSKRAQSQAVPGTGLGLSIARSVAEAHGGSIEATSTEGLGTTMVIRLPLVGTDPG